MTCVLPPFLVLALVGLVLSLAAHVAALIGQPLPGAATWWLWIGILVVWPRAFFVFRRQPGHGKGRDPQEAALRGCPPWMEELTNAIALYATVDFSIVFVWHASGLDQRQGTNAPPEHMLWAVCMAFYAKTAAVLYSGIVLARRDLTRR